MKLPNYPSKVDLVDQLGIDTRLQVDILLHRMVGFRGLSIGYVYRKQPTNRFCSVFFYIFFSNEILIMTDSIDTNQAGIHHAHHDISLMMQDDGLHNQKHNTWVYIWPDKIGDRNNGPTNTEMQTTFWAWTAQP